MEVKQNQTKDLRIKNHLRNLLVNRGIYYFNGGESGIRTRGTV